MSKKVKKLLEKQGYSIILTRDRDCDKSLLERWLAKIKAEAETMNDANEFLERIKGMRMSSPAGETTLEEANQS